MCELPVELSIPGGKVRLEKAARDATVGFEHGDGRHVQTLDAEALSGAVLRVRRTGDEITLWVRLAARSSRTIL